MLIFVDLDGLAHILWPAFAALLQALEPGIILTSIDLLLEHRCLTDGRFLVAQVNGGRYEWPQLLGLGEGQSSDKL